MLRQIAGIKQDYQDLKSEFQALKQIVVAMQDNQGPTTKLAKFPVFKDADSLSDVLQTDCAAMVGNAFCSLSIQLFIKLN